MMRDVSLDHIQRIAWAGPLSSSLDGVMRPFARSILEDGERMWSKIPNLLENTVHDFSKGVRDEAVTFDTNSV